MSPLDFVAVVVSGFRHVFVFCLRLDSLWLRSASVVIYVLHICVSRSHFTMWAPCTTCVMVFFIFCVCVMSSVFLYSRIWFLVSPWARFLLCRPVTTPSALKCELCWFCVSTSCRTVSWDLHHTVCLGSRGNVWTSFTCWGLSWVELSFYLFCFVSGVLVLVLWGRDVSHDFLQGHVVLLWKLSSHNYSNLSWRWSCSFGPILFLSFTSPCFHISRVLPNTGPIHLIYFPLNQRGICYILYLKYSELKYVLNSHAEDIRVCFKN